MDKPKFLVEYSLSNNCGMPRILSLALLLNTMLTPSECLYPSHAKIDSLDGRLAENLQPPTRMPEKILNRSLLQIKRSFLNMTLLLINDLSICVFRVFPTYVKIREIIIRFDKLRTLFQFLGFENWTVLLLLTENPTHYNPVPHCSHIESNINILCSKRINETLYDFKICHKCFIKHMEKHDSNFHKAFADYARA